MNIVYIVATRGWDKKFKLCIDSWERYCARHSIKLEVCIDSVSSLDIVGNDAWQVWTMPKALEFEKAFFVDADTFVHHAAPSIFEVTEGESFSVVKDSNTVSSASYHLPQWKNFDYEIVPFENYFNTGIICLDHEKYSLVREDIQRYYEDWLKNRQDAYEQSAVNIIVNTHFKDEISFLKTSWNQIVVNKPSFNYRDGSYLWHFAGMEYKRRLQLIRGLDEQRYE